MGPGLRVLVGRESFAPRSCCRGWKGRNQSELCEALESNTASAKWTAVAWLKSVAGCVPSSSKHGCEFLSTFRKLLQFKMVLHVVLACSRHVDSSAWCLTCQAPHALALFYF